MNGRYILLVEDNPDEVALTLRAFRKSDFKHDIVIVNDGVEALDFLFARGSYAERDITHLPDVVLLDLKLPRLNGHEVLERLRTDGRTGLVPVVMLTSSQEQEDVVRSYRLGANSYIRKPVDFTRLTDVIHHVAFYWLTLNEAPPWF